MDLLGGEVKLDNFRMGTICTPMSLVLVESLDGRDVIIQRVTPESPSMHWCHMCPVEKKETEYHLRITKIGGQTRGQLLTINRQVLGDIALDTVFEPTLAVLNDRREGKEVYQILFDRSEHDYVFRAIEVGTHNEIGRRQGLEEGEFPLGDLLVRVSATKRGVDAFFMRGENRVYVGINFVDLHHDYLPRPGLQLRTDPLNDPMFDAAHRD